jgi:hypothetical protein
MVVIYNTAQFRAQAGLAEALAAHSHHVVLTELISCALGKDPGARNLAVSDRGKS